MSLNVFFTADAQAPSADLDIDTPSAGLSVNGKISSVDWCLARVNMC